MKSPALLDQNKIVSIPVYLGITTSGASNEYLTSDCGVRKTEGGAYTFKAHADSTGAATLGVYGSASAPIKKANGSDASIKAGGVYTVRYSAPNFILQGEGASGDASASDLLSGKKATTDAGEITGTMPNRAGDNTALASSVSGTTLKLRPPSGFYDGVDDNVMITDADFVAANIKKDVNLFGLIGTLATGAVMAEFNPTSVGYCGSYIQVESTGGIRPLAIICPVSSGQTYLGAGTSLLGSNQVASNQYTYPISTAIKNQLKFRAGAMTFDEFISAGGNLAMVSSDLNTWNNDTMTNNGGNVYWSATRPNFEGDEYNLRGWTQVGRIWKNGNDFGFMLKVNTGANRVLTCPVYVIGMKEY